MSTLPLDRVNWATAGDPAEREAPDAPRLPGGDAAPAPPRPAPAKGYLLEEQDPAKVCRHVEDVLWKPWTRRIKNFNEQWKANEYAMKGKLGYRVVEDIDTATCTLRAPFDGGEYGVGMPRVPQLIDRTIATLMVDPPLPECVPTSTDDADRDRAELGTKLLREDAGDTGGSLRADMERALALAAVYGSGFVLEEVDPQGGGWEPLQIDAHPNAVQFDDANPAGVLEDPAPPAFDPMMGLPVEAAPLEPVKKYVTEAGRLIDSAASDDDADPVRMAWKPKTVSRLLTGRHLRFVPETATGITDATGIVYCVPVSLGDLAARYPLDGVDLQNPEVRAALVDWRPHGVKMKDVLPAGVVIENDGKATDKTTGVYSDQALALVLCVVYKSHGAYPKGAMVCVAGGKFLLYRRAWAERVGEGPTAREECLDLPVSQYRWKTDPTGANPYGVGGVQCLAAGDDVRNALDAGIMEHLYMILHPNVYMDYASTVQPGQLALRDGTPILTNLSATGGPPVYEQIPPLPALVTNFRALISDEMNSAAMLEETAQGVDTPTAVSGRAKEAVIAQAKVALSGLRANGIDGFVRTCRIRLQLKRAFYTGEQILRYTGEDGGTLTRAWTGADLSGVTDVRVAAGSFTQLNREQKQQLAQNEFMLSSQYDQTAYARYRKTQASLIDPVLGQEPDKHRMRVRRQIREWGDGPPDGVVQVPPPPMPMGPEMGAPVPDMGTEPGAPPMAPPAPPADPRAVAIFAPLPVDEDPIVAAVRAEELGDAMAGGTFAKWNTPETAAWCQPYVAEYQRMFAAAGKQTAAQAAAAQAEAAAREADADGAKEDRADQRAGADRDHKETLAAMKPQPARAA